jgi:glycosyltransferase involved in cell wall biosynthesis
MVMGRGIDTQLFHPQHRQAQLRHQWGATENDTVALFVSRLAPEKNLQVVIESWLQMRTINPRTKLVMVGDGPERAALQAAHSEVIFTGMRTGMDLAEHYASADVFLFPSTTETYGNVTMEAMASGLAVVAYDYAAAHEHIQHQQNGLLAKFNDVDDFAHQAMHLAVNPQHAWQLGSNARRTTETLDWEKIHDRFEAVLLDVLHELEIGHPQSA